MSNKPKRLLEQYDILIEYLDYDYIRKCDDGRMLEKIVLILRSGQEGHFPDLTSFAENRLQSVKPNSKLFRKETPLITKHSSTRECWEKVNEDMAEWENDMQKLYKDILEQKEIPIENVVPIRTVMNGDGINTACSKTPLSNQRIKSCDYSNWDRYDADAEILKMDLDKERHKELVIKENTKKSRFKDTEGEKITEIQGLSKPERRVIAEKYKEKGNDYFRGKEYELALFEYDQSIAIFATATCFNNRAITNIKLKHYNKAISDCDACLHIEPNNIKALCRKANALLLNDKRHMAYQEFLRVLALEPKNKIALEAVVDLRRQIPDLPPPNAFALKIETIRSDDTEEDDEYATLIKPKKIIKDKLPETVKNLRTETAKIVQKSVSTKMQNDTIEILPRFTKKAFIEEMK